jgi:hypothetical protein
MNKLLLLLLVPTVCLAHTTWLCTEESSQREGNVIKACGVATASLEPLARAGAFDQAKAELGRVCAVGADCHGHQVVITPKRTLCERVASGYRCYRLVEFEVQDTLVAVLQPRAERPKPVVAALPGQPVDVVDITSYGEKKRRLQYFYTGHDVCVYSDCYIVVNGGKVELYEGVRPELKQ